MPAQILASDSQNTQILIDIPHGTSMMDFEENLVASFNEAGQLATGKQLEYLDTDGSPITMGSVRMTSKRKKEAKVYETLWGAVTVERYVYQSSTGGSVFCPLDQKARIVVNSTPYYARLVSWKYAHMSAPEVQEDLHQNHGRSICLATIRDLADVVATIAQCKEADWTYEIPELQKEVKTVALGLDGTTILYYDGYREAMCGSIALYDDEGNRLHTIYSAAAPEYGKQTFFARFMEQIRKIKQRYPEAIYVGIADGAADNWKFLAPLVSVQILDFYHASSYVADAADALFPTPSALPERHCWLKQQLHELKHKKGGARKLKKLLDQRSPGNRKKVSSEKLSRARTYFHNHSHQMIYPQALTQNLPIGSGVTEAACKTIVKQRLGRSGMRWKERGASLLLSLRALVKSSGQWAAFWSKMTRYGFPVAHNLKTVH